MPDATLAQGFVGAARALVPGTARRPRQAYLRRAVSTAYYAVFHALARTCADALVGATRRSRPNKAWVEVYRGLDHGPARNACSQTANVGFPAGIEDFADAFKQLQAARHLVDYDPMIRLSKVEAEGFITLAEDSIAALKAVGRTDRVAFATWVLITTKGAGSARSRARAGNMRAVN